MVCLRCIKAVQQAAELSGIKIRNIHLGVLEAEQEELQDKQLEQFDNILINLGFERFDDKKTRLAEKVKMLVIEQIHHSDEQLNINWSQLITNQLNYEYNYISKLFSTLEGVTIEQFIIRQKIEKIKELLSYDEQSLAEIADRLGYSSTAYLTNQFKKYTGMTPRYYSKLIEKNRSPLDKL